MQKPEVNIQPAEKRVTNFNEVSLGYSKRLVIDEAMRCPQCAHPICADVTQGCPLGISVPKFIRCLREGNVTGAYDYIKQNNCFASICGRICSAPCEVACVLSEDKSPIQIRELERFAADFGRTRFVKKIQKNLNDKKVAIIGAGPCGLTAGWKLAKQGYQVTVFEALDKPGGVLRYGVPDFRVPKKVLDSEINNIKSLGVKIKTNFFIGKTATIDDLKSQGFEGILIATGAGTPKFMNVKGTNLGGVYYGEEFLMRVNLTKTSIFSKYIPTFPIGEKIVVVGAGNTALDCARAAVRFEKQVTLIFRRPEDETFVRQEEREFGKAEGIKVEPMIKVVEILSDDKGSTAGVKCIRMDYADVDGNWEIIPVPDSEFTIEADTVIIAIGHKPNSTLSDTCTEIKVNRNKTVKINREDCSTSVEGVFAAGNVATGANPLINAMAQGLKAAESIDKFLS
ncbi:MAG: FAD-dependent oxidoreductase [Candidatus Zapsychrus exili]|nr:FAD-dependent oxidoreductase [Candidatus Zapsychrus exili]